MLKELRDHIYRVRHYTLKDRLNRGYRLHYLLNYARWILFYKYSNRKFLIELQNGHKSWVYPYPDHDAGEANIFTRNVDYYDNAFVRKVLSPGDFVVDAGCNVGNRTLVLADLISGALMIDANTDAIKRVRENLALNQIDATNYFLLTKAVGENRGVVRFTNYGGASTQNNVVKEQGAELNFVEVEMTTIDHEINLLKKRPAFIKIDVEGLDFEVLKGAVNTLREGSVKLVKFETNKKAQINDIIDFFDALSWEVFALDKAGNPSQEQSLLFSNPNLFASPRMLFSSFK